MYFVLKYVHAIAALATVAGFMLRGYWMLTESPLLSHRVTRVAPHIIDTVLLLAGIGMLWTVRLNPLTQSWLLAKFAGLIAYIVLGSIAIRRTVQDTFSRSAARTTTRNTASARPTAASGAFRVPYPNVRLHWK